MNLFEALSWLSAFYLVFRGLWKLQTYYYIWKYARWVRSNRL